MKLPVAISGFVLALIATCTAVRAYEQHLDSETIREAYFLGQRWDEATARFLASYQRNFPLPKTGPHIAIVKALTPYAQIVLNAGKGTAIDAEEEYGHRPPDFQVRVAIYSTPTYSLPDCENMIRAFPVKIFQKNSISPKSETCSDLPGTPHVHQSSGAELILDFCTGQVASSPITIDSVP